jgi:hypothetical protein
MLFGTVHYEMQVVCSAELSEKMKNSQRTVHNLYLTALGGLVVSVLATGPKGYSVAGSNPTEDGG